jgi:hypothetical protein
MTATSAPALGIVLVPTLPPEATAGWGKWDPGPRHR